MTKGSDRAGSDDGLGERLRELDSASEANDRELIDRMFQNVKGQCSHSDKTIAGFFRSRSTNVRRLIVLAVFAVLAVIGWYNFPLVNESVRTGPWAATLAVFCILLVVAMIMVTRPVHQPELPRWQVVCLVCVAVGATVLAAFWPAAGAQAITHEHTSRMVAGACMGFGLLLGVPVYALLRLVDRGNAFGSLIAASAAGLAGNFVLKAHCAIDTTGHVLLGHASVAVLFVVGLGLVHYWIPSK
ncbi:MAG: DUF1109 domain-containing protein [Myxococcales bacterium]|nr:DUF1109 domain-containing protein [Myxococcales bacterium]MDH3484005.1 DUF1109 domain-containing protein [Myxococcales bacterium]